MNSRETPTEDIMQYVCVHCPKGCVIPVTVPEGGDRSDTASLILVGNKCKHGVEYAKQELVEPRRVLTTTVRIRSSERMLPVRSTKPLPRERLMEVMKVLDMVEVSLPVDCGQIVYNNILDLDADIVSTWSIKQ